MSASTSAASVSSASTAPGSSGLGSATVGKSGSGANWLVDDVHIGEPGTYQRVEDELAADAVQRRDRDTHRSVGVPDLRRAFDVALNLVDPGRRDRLPRDLVGVRRVGHRPLDLPVGRRHDREAVVEVDLVAVVRRRVMRRRDLDARDRAAVADSKRDYRRGDRGEHQFDGKSLSRKNFSGGQRKLVRAVPGIAADHDIAAVQAAVFEHLGDSPRGA